MIMAGMKNLLLRWLLSGVVLCFDLAVCWAEEPATQSAAPQTEGAPPKAEAVAPTIENEAPKALEKSCPAPVVVELPKKSAARPVFVSDWGRLAALTESDPAVAAKANSLASRQEHIRWFRATGIMAAIGLVGGGIMGRLAVTDHWTNNEEWAVFAGASVAAVTLLLSWALSPERDDLLTVINHWNLRHPERPLAP